MRLAVADRACVRCRDRRVKCGKERPGCQRCAKSGLPCPGYDLSHTFLDAGERVRERYGAYSDPAQPTPSASTAVPPRNLVQRQADSSPLKRKASAGQGGQAFSFMNARSTGEPGLHQSAPDCLEARPLQQHSRNEQSSTAGNHLDNESMMSLSKQMDSGLEDAFFDIDPELYYGIHLNSCGLVPEQNQPHAEVDPWSLDALLSEEYRESFTPGTSLDTFSLPDKALADSRSDETAYLTMHFVEVLGPWMDCFDPDMYFSRLMPSRALENFLLRSCISAYAAKQLGRLTANTAYVDHGRFRPSILRVYPNLTPSDWFYKAASYYDRAICSLRAYLEDWSSASSAIESMTQPLPELSESAEAHTDLPPCKRQRVSAPATNDSNRDDLLIAVAILSGYDTLDQHDTDSLQHLNGFQTILSSGDLPGALRQEEDSDNIPKSTLIARRAVFWNFARVDCTTAYINHKRPRLDVEDTATWRAAGLPITDDGRFVLSHDDGRMDWPSDESACRALIWLLLRIMNYLIDGEEQETLLHSANWKSVEKLLDSWHESLPPAFKPYAQISHVDSNLTKPVTANTPFVEMLFCKPSCAAAMQLYHFARILLLLNSPTQQASHATADRLRMYREISKKSEAHGREICGIVMGYLRHASPPPLAQPLYLAGLCLDSQADRELVLELLGSIELESGHSTEYRRLELRSQWGWPK